MGGSLLDFKSQLPEYSESSLGNDLKTRSMGMTLFLIFLFDFWLQDGLNY
jgi:hypothetical protein